MIDDAEAIRPGKAVGVLVPNANPTIEPELYRLLPPSVALYAARFPVMPGTTLLERNRRYVELYPEMVKAFGSLRLSALVIGLTGPTYRLGPSADRDLSRELTLLADGPSVATASHAIAEAVAALGAQRLALVSPYPAWLTDEAVGYWQEAGFQIDQVVKVSETFRAYELDSDEVGDALSRVAFGDVDAVVMSGTGMLTLPAVVAARRTTTTPILSSNLCAAWWLMREAGVPAGTALFGSASPELARRL